MGKNEKLLERFKKKPKDFTYSELKRLLEGFGYKEDESRAGSRVAFIHRDTNDMIRLHKPHPGNQIKLYLMDQILEHLKEQKYI